MTFSERWLIAGASGLLGVRLVANLLEKRRDVVALHWTHSLPEALSPRPLCIDLLASEQASRDAVEQSRPDVVVNCVGLTNVDQCEKEPERAALLNATLAGRLAEAAREGGARFVQISTDHLWDGTRSFVTEDIPPHPINVYAKTKAAGEEAARSAHPEALVLRTNFFGPSLPWRMSFNDWLTDELSRGRTVNAFSDVFFTPVSSDLLSEMIFELVEKDVSGVLNLAGHDGISKYEFACRWAAYAGLDRSLIREGSVKDHDFAAPRPSDMSLDCSKAASILGRPMPTFQESLESLGRRQPVS